MHCRLASWGKEGLHHFWCGRVGPQNCLEIRSNWGPIWLGWIQPNFGFCNSLAWIIRWGVFRSFSYPTMLVQLPETHKMRSVCDLGVQFHSVYDIFLPPNTCTMHHDKLFGRYSTAKVQWTVRFACLHGFLPWEISKNRTYNKLCTRWWSQIFFCFSPTWGNDPIWRAYFFSTGWVDFNHQAAVVMWGLVPLPRLLSGWTCNLGLQMLALRPTKKNGRRKSRLSGSRWISLEIRFLCWHF